MKSGSQDIYWWSAAGLPGGGGGSVGTPTYIPQNDPHDTLIILNIHNWCKKNSKKIAHEIRLPGYILVVSRRAPRGGGGGGSVGTPTYIPQNDPHDTLIILNIHNWCKKNSKKIAHEIRLPGYILVVSRRAPRGGGGGGSVGTPTYIPQNDPHDTLIILNIHNWCKKNSKKIAHEIRLPGYILVVSRRAPRGGGGVGGYPNIHTSK